MRVLIVDDHELFRSGLRFQISALDPAIDVVEVDTFTHAIGTLADLAFDLVFLDVMIPDRLDWRETLGMIRALSTPPRVVVLSGNDGALLVQDAIDLGAVAFIPKGLKGDILESALRLVLMGGFSIIPGGSSRAFRSPGVNGGPPPESGNGGDDFFLTPRQQEVLEFINAGLPNRRIATEMDLSEATIKMHIGRLFKALGAQSRTDALAVARKRGLL